MLHLYVFGSPRLEGDASNALGRQELVGQPKTLAVLLYLALARPRGPHQRDRLAGLLWSESDQEHARAALRKALQRLRSMFGEEIIESNGTESLSIAKDAVWCDAVAFDAALERERLREALDLYTAELLPSFYISHTAEFEHWLEGERSRYRERAAGAAWRLVEFYEASRDYTNAAQLARVVARFASSDERMLRRVLALLVRVGDRAGAMAVYRRFSEQLRTEYEVEPSPETARMAEAIQRGDAV